MEILENLDNIDERKEKFVSLAITALDTYGPEQLKGKLAPVKKILKKSDLSFVGTLVKSRTFVTTAIGFTQYQKSIGSGSSAIMAMEYAVKGFSSNTPITRVLYFSSSVLAGSGSALQRVGLTQYGLSSVFLANLVGSGAAGVETYYQCISNPEKIFVNGVHCIGHCLKTYCKTQAKSAFKDATGYLTAIDNVGELLKKVLK